MIQFNRYKLPDETHDFHGAFVTLVDTIAAEINGDCDRSIGLLLAMSERYPLNDRIPAVAARLFFWGKVSWNTIERMMPAKLPTTFFYAQELVGCLGFEHSSRKWGIDEDLWRLYQGFTNADHPPPDTVVGTVSYQPRNSGFFSVMENIVAAHILAELEGMQVVIDLDGNWWNYDEPFEDIFEGTFEFTKNAKVTSLPMIQFEHMRDKWINADSRLASYLASMKEDYYNAIYFDISNYAAPSLNVDSAGVMFVRGGDKLQTETILPPMGFLLRDLKWMARRCDERYILSDDKRVGEAVASLDAFAIDRTNQVEGGYHHIPHRKVSCMNLLSNYLMMVDAKENMSCPSANLVNAAQWSRNDKENYSLSNPVYRYLLI
jgi:hypothetical protein